MADTVNGYNIDAFLHHVFKHAAGARSYDPKNCAGCWGIRSTLATLAMQGPPGGMDTEVAERRRLVEIFNNLAPAAVGKLDERAEHSEEEG